jgi:hypothetical protein
MPDPHISLKVTSLIHKETGNKAAIVSVKIIIPFRWSFNWFYELFQNPIKTRKYLAANGKVYQTPFVFKSYEFFVQGFESFQKRLKTYYADFDFEINDQFKRRIKELFDDDK